MSDGSPGDGEGYAVHPWGRSTIRDGSPGDLVHLRGRSTITIGSHGDGDGYLSLVHPQCRYTINMNVNLFVLQVLGMYIAVNFC